jgi:hypothetical protein
VLQRLLYQLQRIATAPAGAPIFITEGEKDADRLNNLGQYATTAANGSWKSVDTSPLSFRDIFAMEAHFTIFKAFPSKVDTIARK